MGGEPKQLRLLGGRPTVCWAARTLLSALAGPTVVVLPADRLEEGEALLAGHLGDLGGRIGVVAGGETRRDSVRAGLEALEDAETVLVHDAARPFASPALVERVGARAVGGRAVVPALPVVDTLKEVDGERVVRTVDRTRYVAAQTPQGFPRALLGRAHDETTGDGATDDASLCERIGAPVTWIEGEEINRKLTAPGDWSWAERILEEGWIRWSEAR